MDWRERWEIFVALTSIVVSFLMVGAYPIAATCLLIYGIVIGYRTRSDRFREMTEEAPLEFFLFTTLLLLIGLADLLEWI